MVVWIVRAKHASDVKTVEREQHTQGFVTTRPVVHELAKFFAQKDADAHAGALKDRVSGWAEIEVVSRDEDEAAQHPAHRPPASAAPMPIVPAKATPSVKPAALK